MVLPPIRLLLFPLLKFFSRPFKLPNTIRGVGDITAFAKRLLPFALPVGLHKPATHRRPTDCTTETSAKKHKRRLVLHTRAFSHFGDAVTSGANESRKREQRRASSGTPSESPKREQRSTTSGKPQPTAITITTDPCCSNGTQTGMRTPRALFYLHAFWPYRAQGWALTLTLEISDVS